jgi:putative hemolysin
LDPEPSLAFLSLLNTDLLFATVGIIALLFGSAMISASEVALFSLTATDLQSLRDQNQKVAIKVEELISKPKKLLATILVANNFINIAVVILFSYSFHDSFSAIANPVVKFIIEVVLVTFLLLLFGEVLPKIYASRNNVKFAIFIGLPIYVLDVLLTPISVPMRGITIYIQEKLGKQRTSFSVDQLSQALELTSIDESSQEEQKILEGIVAFGNTDTKQVMTPRTDLFALNIEDSFTDVFDLIVEKGYSRIPVYEDNIDHIKGVLFVKDLIPHINKKEFQWNTLLREAFFVPENKKLDDLLKEFQTMKSHLAIVVDEYGGTSGLVSLEDIIEEIVGDISDEFDDENLTYSKINDFTYIFEGKINLRDFYRVLDVNADIFEASKGEAETLAGFILEIIGNFPRKSQKIVFDNCVFQIEAIDKKRIKQIKVTLDVNA